MAFVLALCFGLQVYLGSAQKSVTWDEPGYVSAGYANWTEADYRLNVDHPPLMQKLQALPLLWLPISSPPLSELAWGEDLNPRATYGSRFFFASGNDPLQLTRWSRAPVMLLGMLLVLVLYAWGRELFSPEAALLVSALAAFDPNLIAHSKLATEDLGCAALMFAAVFCWWRWLKAPELGRALLCGGVTALALLSKYTALLLLPIDIALMLVLWMHRPPAKKGARLARDLMAMIAVALVSINFAYGSGFHLHRYFAGILKIYPDVSAEYLYYFWGQVSERPYWYHGAASLVLKAPLALWLLWPLAAVVTVRSSSALRAAAGILLPGLFVVAASFFDQTNPGVRRVLPALPFLLLFAGFALYGQPRPAVRIGVWLLVMVSAVEASWIFPHHLSYLNPLIGGPDRGPYVFDESNIDWGQDLPALAQWQSVHLSEEPLALYYFGRGQPAAYGVDAVPLDLEGLSAPAPGVVAVSAHYLVQFRKVHVSTGRDTDWLTKYEPLAKAGYSIFIYRFP